MGESFEMIAKTFQGLEEVLAEELTNLGANDIEIGRRMVRFTGDKRMLYKANFCLRTAIRVLKPILRFTAHNADEVYEAVKGVKWDKYMDVKSTFSIDSVVFSETFHHSMFVAYKVKDAIADYFRDKTGERPNVRLNNPDVKLNIHIAENDCTLSLDSSGESLHRRGYRQKTLEAPLNEVLAAGMILMTGWRGECDFIDPMCGSGTLPIEAALIARNVWPGVFGRHYDFEKWPDFDPDLLDEIYNDDSEERTFEHHIYGYDLNVYAIEVANTNAKAASVTKDVTFMQQDIANFVQPEQPALMITNPPYGERIGSPDLLGLYQTLGERLKHAFVGNSAWIISYKDECIQEIGLKPTKKVPLYNGELECKFLQYEIFGGKYKEFRSEGEKLNKEEPVVRPKVLRKPRREELFKDKEPVVVENERYYGHEKFKEWEQREARKAEKLRRAAEAEHAEKTETDTAESKPKERRSGFKSDRKPAGFKGKGGFKRDGAKGKRDGDFKGKRDGFKGKRDGDFKGKRDGDFKGKRDGFKGKRDDFKGKPKAKAESYPERKKRELKEKLMNNQ